MQNVKHREKSPGHDRGRVLAVREISHTVTPVTNSPDSAIGSVRSSARYSR